MAAGLVVGAPSSGSGKTVVTLGLLRALARRGVAVAGAKAGPDYIDPAFHAAATGRPAHNLDLWAMRPETLADSLRRVSAGAELVLVEGVMGLYDGIGAAGAGCTADLAAALGWPVLLVLDARGAAASVGAMLGGFARHRTPSPVAAAVINRVGSATHADLVSQACQRACPDVAMLGCLPRDPALALPERHLGLVQAGEHAALERFLEAAADLVERQLDLGLLQDLARPGRAPGEAASDRLPPLGQRIAVASDRAFAFRYDAVLQRWAEAGAELFPFSPLADEAPAAGMDAVYLPGGYPELEAARLGANGRFISGLRAAAARGAVVFGECGGYMVLGRALVDAAGQSQPMADLLPLVTSFAEPRLHLGYRRARLVAAGPLGPVGRRFRGHEFHYAAIIEEGPGDPLFEAADAEDRRRFPAGLVVGSVAGSFIHLVDRTAD